MYIIVYHVHRFTPPCGVTNVTGQCGCDNVINMFAPSSATLQGSQSDSLKFAAKVLDAWTNARPMKCRAMKWHAINCRSIKCRRTLISGTGKATDFKFGKYIYMAIPNKSPLKILEKMDRGRIQGLAK